MVQKHIRPQDLIGRTVDVHAHTGFSIDRFAQIGFPYCSSLEDLYYRQEYNGVDYSTVFPLNPDLYFDIYTHVATGRLVPAEKPISKFPYELENRMLLTEVFDFCPELAHHFMPFISVDPGRKVQEQIELLRGLDEEFPIYGMKIVPVACQSSVTKLLEEGGAFLEFAKERDWPVLFHVTIHPDEQFSQASDTFKVIQRHPELRCCLAHSISFHREFLERADAMPNVWFETSGVKIMGQLACERSPVMGSPSDLFDWDYSDHVEVMQALVEHFPKSILWGSDAPYHSYIHRRLQAEGKYYESRLKATYEEEKAGFDALSAGAREQINRNTIEFISGS